MHKWTKYTRSGNPKCEKCGLIKEVYGKGNSTRAAYYRGNKPAGIGPLEDQVPPCLPKNRGAGPLS